MKYKFLKVSFLILFAALVLDTLFFCSFLAIFCIIAFKKLPQDLCLKRIIGVTFILRLLVAVFLYDYAFLFNRVTFGEHGYVLPSWPYFSDASYTLLRSLWIAKYHLGKITNYLFLSELKNYGESLYNYIIAFVFYLFGFQPFHIVMMNLLFGCAMIIVMYQLALILFCKRVACYTVLFISFMPSLFIISLMPLRDIAVSLNLVLFFFFIAKTLTEFRWRYVLYIPLSSFTLTLLRSRIPYSYLLLFFVFSVIAMWFFQKRRLPLLGGLLLIVFSINYFQPRLFQPLKEQAVTGLNELYHFHKAYVTVGTTYKILDNHRYHESEKVLITAPLEHVRVFFRAWWHFLLQPFPRADGRVVSFITSCEQLIWYLCLPLLAVGIFMSLHIYASRVLLCFIFILSSLLALSSGNVGTLVRHKTMITPFLFMYVAIGLDYMVNLWRVRKVGVGVTRR